MADIILDSVFEVVQKALVQNNFLKDVGLVKDYANYSLILQLKNWANINFGEDTNSFSEDDYLYETYYDHNEDEPDVEKTVKIENNVNENSENIHTIDGSEQKNNGSVSLVKVDARTNLESCKIEQPVSENQSEETSETKVNEKDNEYSLKNSIPPKKSKKKVSKKGKSSVGIGFNVKFKLSPKYLERLKKEKNRKEEARAKKKCVPSKKVKCGVCDYQAENMSVMRKHHAVKHSSERPHVCSLCDMKFKRADYLKNHMRTHTGEKPYKCDQCDAEFTRSSDRYCHTKIWHSNVKSESCKYCDYTAKFRNLVRAHEKRMHLQSAKLFKCQQCGAATTDEARHKDHVRAHELNVSFDCFCGKSFTNHQDLKWHLKRTHNPVEKKQHDISCPDCDKKFRNNSNLKSHMFLHTGVKAFSCRLCNSSFGLFSSMLKHHNKKHQNESMFHCEACNFFTNNLKERKKHITSSTHLEKIPNATWTESEIGSHGGDTVRINGAKPSDG